MVEKERWEVEKEKYFERTKEKEREREREKEREKENEKKHFSGEIETQRKDEMPSTPQLPHYSSSSLLSPLQIANHLRCEDFL